jgi:hypothetical protein
VPRRRRCVAARSAARTCRDAASLDDEPLDRVAACLISSVPGLDDGAARDVLAAAGAGHGRALREIDALLKEYPGALVTTPAAYPLVLVRLAHALIAAGYLLGLL